MEKTCPQCGKHASTVSQVKKQFGMRWINGQEKPQSYCKECMKEYRKENKVTTNPKAHEVQLPFDFDVEEDEVPDTEKLHSVKDFHGHFKIVPDEESQEDVTDLLHISLQEMEKIIADAKRLRLAGTIMLGIKKI